MNITFSKWLRTSNEAKPLRDAFDLVDQMPETFGLKAQAFETVRRVAETQWSLTVEALSVEESNG